GLNVIIQRGTHPSPCTLSVGRGERGLGRLTAASHHYRVPAAAGRRGALPDGVDDGTRGGTRRYHNTCDASCRNTGAATSPPEYAPRGSSSATSTARRGLGMGTIPRKDAT